MHNSPVFCHKKISTPLQQQEDKKPVSIAKVLEISMINPWIFWGGKDSELQLKMMMNLGNRERTYNCLLCNHLQKLEVAVNIDHIVALTANGHGWWSTRSCGDKRELCFEIRADHLLLCFSFVHVFRSWVPQLYCLLVISLPLYHSLSTHILLLHRIISPYAEADSGSHYFQLELYTYMCKI